MCWFSALKIEMEMPLMEFIKRVHVLQDERIQKCDCVAAKNNVIPSNLLVESLSRSLEMRQEKIRNT